MDAILGLVVLALIIGTSKGSRVVMAIAAALYGLWTALQIESWWIPYFRGASPGWKVIYARFFAETFRFLPGDGDHLAPDACHVLLQVLVAVALGTTVAGAVNRHNRI